MRLRCCSSCIEFIHKCTYVTGGKDDVSVADATAQAQENEDAHVSIEADRALIQWRRSCNGESWNGESCNGGSWNGERDHDRNRCCHDHDTHDIM